VNGAVTLASDITSSGNQIYNDGAVSLGRTLKLSASSISFNGGVGDSSMSYATYLSAHNAGTINVYNLVVEASIININSDIYTFGTQTYGSSGSLARIIIGDNGANGITRTLVSEDPAVTFWGTVDDALAGTHNLIVKSVTFDGLDVPTIDFKGDVGATAALKSLIITTGKQDHGANPILTVTAASPLDYLGVISIEGNVSTTEDQTYTANSFTLGNGTANQILRFTTESGDITFNSGSTGSGFTQSGSGLTVDISKSGGTVSGLDGKGLTIIEANQSVGNSGFSSVSSGQILSEINRFLSEIDRFGLAANDVSIDYRQVGNGGSMDVICIDYDGSGNCKFDN
jgi:hypothetical protein